MTSLAFAIRSALLTAEPRAKVSATRQLVRNWRKGLLSWDFEVEMPDKPAWPERPELLTPNKMPKRGKGGSERGRIALWHSLAHIEFVAIDLALDMAGRFGEDMGRKFVEDFLSVAADEAMHFALLARKLESLGSFYGALPAHAGLWEAAYETRHDVRARLAIVPMVLEARGLDVTPSTLQRVKSQGDANGAKMLQRILDDEIRHVAIGTKHFSDSAQKSGESAPKLWQSLVEKHFRGRIKPPFNDSARQAAGLSLDYYGGIAS
ncbi:ferritin-like domain-containing protein [Altererythrobacter lutimaris]|uniref:Ferritin-like domain-containing protein n=1 Tax=Altererythrobacter lutimaris TaxID=2743979 RepID=A0A850HD30_9SPHN|nr:ferritin-like domain-containing protein [Altererythrobacter lutimaris]NVE95255.1 ferritin-like domain-containing protein [Altererythrobacter lutimaris]